MKRRIFALLLALCMIVAVMAGCSGKTEPSTSTQPSDSQQPSNSAQASTTPDNSKKYGGELIIYGGTTTAETFYFPKFTRGSTQYAPACESLGLMSYDGKITGRLVEGFDIDAKNLTMTMKIREGIKFHDGSDFDAEALAWEINECVAQGNLAVIANATSAEVKDKYTVVVHFDQYGTNWEEMFCQFIVISKQSTEEKGIDYMATHPVGTGPFIFESFEKNVEVKYVKNENYWQEGLPYLDKITYICTSEDTLLSAATNKEIQVATSANGIFDTQFQQYCGSTFTDISADKALKSGYAYFTVNSADEASPFADVLVRRACFYAMDNNAIAKAIMGEMGEGANQSCIPGQYGYFEDTSKLFDTYDYSVEKAKEMLTQAGYPNGFDCTIMARSSNEKQSVAIQSYLKAAGINADIEMVDSSLFTERTTKNGTCDIAQLTGGGGTLNGCVFWNKHVSGNRTRFLTVQATFPGFDELFDKAMNAVGEEEMIKTQQAVNYWLSENLIQIPLYYQYTKTYAVNELKDSNMGGFWYTWTLETAYFE